LAMVDVAPEWISRLQLLALEMRSARDRPQLLELHAAFHAELTSWSRNQRLTEILANLNVQTRAVLPFIDLLSGGREIEAVQHEAVVDAILSGDAAATKALIKAHIGDTADLLEELWSARGESPPGSDGDGGMAARATPSQP
jgi:DNA-binding GntR family transcriptional regulator